MLPILDTSPTAWLKTIAAGRNVLATSPTLCKAAQLQPTCYVLAIFTLCEVCVNGRNVRANWGNCTWAADDFIPNYYLLNKVK